MTGLSFIQANTQGGSPFSFWPHLLIFSIVVIGLLLTTVVIFIWIERRLVGRFQLRQGHKRTGPAGLLQTVADVIKILPKKHHPHTVRQSAILSIPFLAFHLWF